MRINIRFHRKQQPAVTVMSHVLQKYVNYPEGCCAGANPLIPAFPYTERKVNVRTVYDTLFLFVYGLCTLQTKLKYD